MGEDDYYTCHETYVTLRMYHPSAHPDDVSRALGLAPSDIQCAGEEFRREGEKRARTYRLSGWFYCSKGAVVSYDSEKHLHWLCDQLASLGESLRSLRQAGWRMDFSCLWDSHEGHGGPELSPALLRRLADLEIPLWFDVYFFGAYAAVRFAKQVNEDKGSQ